MLYLWVLQKVETFFIKCGTIVNLTTKFLITYLHSGYLHTRVWVAYFKSAFKTTSLYLTASFVRLVATKSRQSWHNNTFHSVFYCGQQNHSDNKFNLIWRFFSFGFVLAENTVFWWAVFYSFTIQFCTLFLHLCKTYSLNLSHVLIWW